MLNKTALLLVVGVSLAGCDRPAPQVLSDSGTVVRLTVEPDAKCGSKYRIFSVGSKFSLAEVCAGSMSLAIGEPKVEIAKEVRGARHLYCPDGSAFLPRSGGTPSRIWECGWIISAVLTLPSCSSYRDTQKYLIKDASSSSGSSGLLGLVYSSRSSSSSKEYQLRDEELIIPCVK